MYENYEDIYAKVLESCAQILEKYMGSVVMYGRYEETETFESLCISFQAIIDGWVAGCRPIIGLYGCHLKGKYGGVCLAMVGLGGDNGIFSLAICICRKEDG